EVATWLAAQAVVAAANLWSLGRNDLLMAALIDHPVPDDARASVAAAALHRAERPGALLALLWGAVAGGSVGQGGELPLAAMGALAAACALAAWCRLRETMAISALRGAGQWQRAALLSAAARLSGAVLALGALAAAWSLPVALLLQSASGLAVRFAALPRAAAGTVPVSLPDLAVRRSLPFFLQMVGNALLHTMDRLVALPLLGVAGAARYGVVSQLTTPLYGVTWGAFVWMVGRQGSADGAALPLPREVRRLALACYGTLGLLLGGWLVAMAVVVPRVLGPQWPPLGTPALTAALMAVLAFAVAVPPYYLLFRHRRGWTTGALVATVAAGWGGALLMIPAASASPLALAASRAVAGVVCAVGAWGALALVRRGAAA
ncbi:MAG: hypothetical protein KJT01_15385, partial [Gemmatimonadetes bacterium]|nr:hypothetical protein [Gemmatimonadota bacterium]